MSNEAETVADLARKAATVQSVTSADGRQFLIVPKDYEAKDVSDAHGLKPGLPKYISQRIEMHALDALIEYVNDYKTPNTLLLADMHANVIMALIDYHGTDGKAANVAHVATMKLPFSEEWTLWTKVDGNLVDQLSFARFIEENHPDVVAPNAGELIDAARDLHAARNIKFTKVVRTDSDNENFTAEDTTSLVSRRTGKPSEGLELPREFTLSIPIYFGESPIELKAYLRWKVADDGMKLGTKLWRPEHVRQAEFKRIVTDAAEKTSLKAIFGTAKV
jgi:uncharacterized protein YfdQ (DUF2303 family)